MAGSSFVDPPHVEFEPYSEWHKEERVETLILDLHDFKREQVRVQVFDKERVLRVSGERPLDETLRITRRFLKEIILPQGCNINDITAKLIRGRLHVIMPIMAPNVDKLRLKSSAARFEKGRNVSMCFGITVAVMMAVGAFVAYNKMWV